MNFTHKAKELSPATTLPEWIEIFPAPNKAGEIVARDGRVFKMPNPQAVADTFLDNKADIAVDLEHASEKSEPGADPTAKRAVGWIRALQVRARAIWAKVDFTSEGAAAVLTQKFRYVSPAFSLKDGVITRLCSLGLVNQPAFFLAPITALASEQRSQSEPEPTIEEAMKITGMDEKGLRKLCGAFGITLGEHVRRFAAAQQAGQLTTFSDAEQPEKVQSASTIGELVLTAQEKHVARQHGMKEEVVIAAKKRAIAAGIY